MDTRHAVLFVIFAGPLSVLHAAAPSTPPSKPNVIVIFSDDHGWADLGCQGVPRDVRTPNLDAVAKGGVRATNGYVTAPQCVPSRAGLLAGRYQNRFGVESNGVDMRGFDSLRAPKSMRGWLKSRTLNGIRPRTSRRGSLRPVSCQTIESSST